MQTLWLVLAATATFLTFKYSFFSGNKLAAGGSKTFEYLTANTSTLILVLSVAVVSGILIDIFLYKNRKLQFRIVLAAILISTLNIFLYYRETKNFVEGNFDLSSIFAFAIPVLLMFAASGIYKDQKLVKSLDRLR